MANILVIGGGPAGLSSAIFASSKKNKVTLIERNSSCGKKLLLTGNGKCNYWNEEQSLSHFHSDDASILEQIITPANLEETWEFLKRIGIIPYIKNGYYYPFSNQAFTMKEALLIECKKRNVTIIENEKVEKIEKKETKFVVQTTSTTYIFDKVVLASGSKAMPKTGSDGEGYTLAKSLGHTITNITPSLVQIILDFPELKKWAGIRTQAKVSLYEGNKKWKEETGELQLTDYGVSGICIFNLSRYVGRNPKNEFQLEINFLPFLDKNGLEFLETQNKLVKNRTIGELLESILHYKLVEILLKMCQIPYNAKWSELKPNKKEKLVELLTKNRIKVIGTKSFDTSQVCAGGVNLNEINPTTLESKKTKNLFIAGELLDIDGDCGGYNLMIAFLTGVLAGKGACEEVD